MSSIRSYLFLVGLGIERQIAILYFSVSGTINPFSNDRDPSTPLVRRSGQVKIVSPILESRPPFQSYRIS